MSLKARILQKIFGTAGPTAEFGKIGSKAAALPIKTKDLALMQTLPEYDQGLAATVSDQGTSQLPFLEDLNSLFFLITSQIAYLMQAGISEWDAETEYYQGISAVLFEGEILIDNFGTPGTPNLNFNPGTNPAKWDPLELTNPLITDPVLNGSPLTKSGTEINDVVDEIEALPSPIVDETTAQTLEGPKTLTDPVIGNGAAVNKVNSIKDQGGVSANGLKFKVYQTGNWNMNSTSSISIAHGLTRQDILFVEVMIFDDGGGEETGKETSLFAAFVKDVVEGYWETSGNSDIILHVNVGGTYQTQANYNDGTINRGRMTIFYKT